MNYYKINIKNNKDFYEKILDCIKGPCYVQATSENEALEKIYQYVKWHENTYVSGDTKKTDRNDFEIAGHEDDIRNFAKNTIHIDNAGIWTSKNSSS